MRCGFCNLFTVAKPKANVRAPYPEVLREQARVTMQSLPDAKFSRLAIGGGTPTQLDVTALAHVCETITDVLGADPTAIPACSEMSPETIDDDKLGLLRDIGIDRASIGIQSFLAHETKSLRRPQDPELAHSALQMIRRHGFETLNIDLIYGIRDQTEATWLDSIEQALRYEPEELYLYPLYVRPLTGLGNSKREAWQDQRHALYIVGRDRLREAGYEQVSMRMFRRTDVVEPDAPIYRCQEDGMVGLGVGARSYTRSVHYCTEYAVGRPSVLGILEEYVERDAERFESVDFGYELDEAEQQRRYLVLSLLSAEGFSPTAFETRFGVPPAFDRYIDILRSNGFAEWHESTKTVRLNDDGVARSDVIGPWLYSTDVTAKIAEYELR